MADDSVIRITTSFDAGPILAGNQQAAASTEQAALSIQASLLKAQLAYKQQITDVKVAAVAVQEANQVFGTSAAEGSAAAASAIAIQKQAFDDLINKAAATKLQVVELTAALKDQAAAAASAGTASAAPNAGAVASASAFEAYGATGSTAAGSESSAAGYEAMIAGQEAAAAAGTTLNEVQEAAVVASEEASEAAMMEAQSYLRLAGVEAGAAATTGRTTVLGRAYASVKQAIASALGLSTTAVAAEAAATNTSAEAATKSASAWAAYAGVTEEATAATVAEGEAETVRSAAVAGSIGPTRAATAELRVLEGGLAGSTRGAAAFLTNTLKLGPVLQAAFPVFGLIAFGAILYEIIEGADKLYQKYVLLRGESEAMGNASEKSAKQAAEANWKYIESYVELLKTQGKYAEALEFEQANQGQKPESIKIEIPEKELKQFPQDFQDFAHSLAAVNTQGQAAAKAYDEVHQRIQKLRDDMPGLVEAAKAAGAAMSEAATVQGPAGASLSLVRSMQEEHAQERLGVQQNMLNSLVNLENKHQSDVAAQQAKGAGQVITLTEKQFSDIDSLEKAHADSRKKIDESELAYREELAKQAVASGRITAEQELAITAEVAKEKLQVEIDYLGKRNAVLAQAPEGETKDRAAREIIENQGQIAALKTEQRTKDIAGDVAAAKASLKAKLDVIDEEIAAVKSVPAAGVKAQEEADAKIAALARQAMAEVQAAEGGATTGEEYKARVKEFEEANRTLYESIKKADEEATQIKLEDLRRVIELDEQQAAKHEADQVRKSSLDAKRAQDQIALQKAQQIRPEGGVLGAVFDSTQIQGDAKKQSDIIQAEYAKQRAASRQLAQEKVADAQQEQAALNSALASGSLSQEKYAQDSMKVQSDITKAVQDNADKQEQITQKAAAEEQKIAQQAAQKQIQLSQQIANSFARETDKMIFESRNLHDALTKLWTDMVKSIIEQIVKMATTFITQKLIMIAIEKVYQAVTGKETGGGKSGVVAGNVLSATSEVGVAAAAAYAGAMLASAGLDLPGALAAAAVAEAAGAVFIAQAAAEGGWDLPNSSGPIPMYGHAKEMMLPRPLAEGFRSIISDQSSRVSSDNRSESRSSTAFHYHAGPVHALDQTGVSAVLAKHAGKFSDAVAQGVKTGKIDPRTFARHAK